MSRVPLRGSHRLVRMMFPKTSLNFFREDILSGGNECAPNFLTLLSSCLTLFFYGVCSSASAHPLFFGLGAARVIQTVVL